MEDRIFANAAMVLPEHQENSKSLNVNQLAFFGVFDGHNGEYVAEMLQCQMAQTLQSYIMPDRTGIARSESQCESEIVWQQARSTSQTIEPKGGLDAEINAVEVLPISLLGKCFIHTAADLDLQILTRDYQRQQCSLHTGTLDVQSFAGCVLATMTVTSRTPNPPPISPTREDHAPFTPTPISPLTNSIKEEDRKSLCLTFTPDGGDHIDQSLDKLISSKRDIDEKGDIDIDKWAESRGVEAELKVDGKEKVRGDLRKEVHTHLHLLSYLHVLCIHLLVSMSRLERIYVYMCVCADVTNIIFGYLYEYLIRSMLWLAIRVTVA